MLPINDELRKIDPHDWSYEISKSIFGEGYVFACFILFLFSCLASIKSKQTERNYYNNFYSSSNTTVVNREIPDGYRFLRAPEVFTSGNIYEKSTEISLKAGKPKPKAVILIHIDEIHSLKPGPMAGKRIG